MDDLREKLPGLIAEGLVKGGAAVGGKYAAERASAALTEASIRLWGAKSTASSHLNSLSSWLYAKTCGTPLQAGENCESSPVSDNCTTDEAGRESDSKNELPPPKLLIIGAGGVGKSTTAHTLVGHHNLASNPPGGYHEDDRVTVHSLADDLQTEIVVPPGQKHRRYSWIEIEKSIAEGQFTGIILVSSYGFHSLGRLSYKTHELFDEQDPARFLNDYLIDRRTEEIRVLKRLIPHLKANKSKCWLLTLVTKEDLWWTDRIEAARHYKNGEYGKALNTVSKNLGENFRHELSFVSLVIGNFLTGEGEVLAENCAGFAQEQQLQSMQLLLQTLESLRKWEF